VLANLSVLKQMSSIKVVFSPSSFTKQRNVAIPATLQAHFFREDSRAEFVLFAEMDKSDAGSLQLLDKLHLESGAHE
jgi:hypothetical protein